MTGNKAVGQTAARGGGILATDLPPVWIHVAVKRSLSVADVY